jgi:hypothetical protein
LMIIAWNPLKWCVLIVLSCESCDFDFTIWSSKVSESSGGCKLSLVGLLLAGSSRADARTRGVLKRVLKMERLRIKVGRYLKYLYVDDS